MPLTRIKLTAIADGGITAAKLANPLNLSSLDVTLPQGVGGTNWTTTPILTPTSDNTNDVPDGGSASGTGYLLSNSSGYFVNTGDGTVTVKLPANPQQGNLYFNRNDNAEYHMPQVVDNETYFTCSRANYAAKSGALYIFPSWLPHGVDGNQSKSDRISLAFNYGEKQ